MSEQPIPIQPPKRKRLSRRDFLILLGVGSAGVILGVKAGTPLLRLRLAEWLENSSGPPADIDAPPDAWFDIQPDNTIRLYLPKVEMGQGVHTGLAQIAADELEVDWEQLKVLHADSSRLADPVATSASNTISSLYLPLRETAATLRELLRSEAAQRWNVQPGDVTMKDSMAFLKNDPAQSLSYAELYQNAAEWELPEEPPALKPQSEFHFIGKSQARVDLPAKINGEAVYGFDVRVPGMLYGAVARPPTIQGRLKSASPGQADAMPGVVKTVIEDNFAGVVAESRLQAYQALEKLELEWESGRLWQQADIDAMVTVGEGQGVVIQKDGDPDDLFKQGPVIEAEYRTPMAYHAYLEPLAAVADVQTGQVHVWAATQAPARLQGKIADALKIDEQTVVITPVYLGGGLGRKLDETAAVDAARLSQSVGRPVHVGMNRPEDFMNGYLRPPTHHRLRAVLGSNGLMQAFEHQQASGEISFPFLPAIMSTVLGADFGSWRGAIIPYAVPERRTVAWLTSLPVATGWWRGLGLMPNNYALESFIDEVAFAAKVDPLEYRLRHLPDTPAGKRIQKALRTAAEQAGWQKPLPTGMGRGVAWCLDYGTIVVEIAEVSVVDNQIQVEKITAAIDPGLIINPNAVEAQTEGGITMGVSASLLEQVMLKDSVLQASNFNNYPLLRNLESPEIDVILINSGSTPSGVGEPPIGPVPAAIANAIFAATGQRLRQLPLKLN